MHVTKMQENQQTLLAVLRSGDLSSERSKEYWEERGDHDLKRDFKDGNEVSKVAVSLQRSENAVAQRLIPMRLLTPPNKRRHRSKRKKQSCLENVIYELLQNKELNGYRNGRVWRIRS